MKILCVSTDWAMVENIGGVQMRVKEKLGGTGSYRLAIPGAELEKHGHTVVHVSLEGLASSEQGLLYGTDFDGNKHFDCDVVWIQRWMSEGADVAIKRAKACGQIVVNDVDDHFGALPTSNIAFNMTHPKANPTFNRNLYMRAIAASSGITVSTPFLADQFKGLGIPVVLCRNAVDLPKWPVNDVTDTGTIGWVGGIPWRGSDLAQLRGILGPHLKKHDLTFVHGGHSPQGPSAADQLGLDITTGKCMICPLVDFRDYPGLWEPIDILVAPLEKSSFNAGKSELKALEACATGVPWIGSGWHPGYQWLAERSAGRLANNAKQWTRHLEELLDPEVRAKEGAANRECAEELQIAKKWQTWERAFKTIAGAA